MTKPIDPYSRVYWRIAEDPRFAAIYPDERHLGTWLRLLMLADAMYPTAAPIPATTRAASVKALIDAGLIESIPGGLYRVHGLAAERERRSRAGADAEPHRNPTGPAKVPARAAPEPVGTLARAGVDETRRDEHRQAEPSTAPEDALDYYYRLTLRYPSGRTKAWITELANEFGHRETGMAIASEYQTSDDLRTILSRVDGRLRSEAHHAELERAKPKARVRLTDEDQAERDRQRLAIVQEWSEPA